MCALAVDPADRFETAGEMERALEAVAAARQIALGHRAIVDVMASLYDDSRRRFARSSAEVAKLARLDPGEAVEEVDDTEPTSRVDLPEPPPMRRAVTETAELPRVGADHRRRGGARSVRAAAAARLLPAGRAARDRPRRRGRVRVPLDGGALEPQVDACMPLDRGHLLHGRRAGRTASRTSSARAGYLGTIMICADHADPVERCRPRSWSASSAARCPRRAASTSGSAARWARSGAFRRPGCRSSAASSTWRSTRRCSSRTSGASRRCSAPGTCRSCSALAMIALCALWNIARRARRRRRRAGHGIVLLGPFAVVDRDRAGFTPASRAPRGAAPARRSARRHPDRDVELHGLGQRLDDRRRGRPAAAHVPARDARRRPARGAHLRRCRSSPCRAPASTRGAGPPAAGSTSARTVGGNALATGDHARRRDRRGRHRSTR